DISSRRLADRREWVFARLVLRFGTALGRSAPYRSSASSARQRSSRPGGSRGEGRASGGGPPTVQRPPPSLARAGGTRDSAPGVAANFRSPSLPSRASR